MTLAFSCEVVHEKLWKSVNICKSYSQKNQCHLFFWTRCNRDLHYTVVQKNAPNSADYNYDPVQSILIIFSKLFVNDHKSCPVVKFSTSPHICCHYILWNTMLYFALITLLIAKTAPSLVSQAHRAPDLWPPNSPELNPVDYRIWGLMQQRLYKTPVRDTIDLKKRLVDT